MKCLLAIFLILLPMAPIQAQGSSLSSGTGRLDLLPEGRAILTWSDGSQELDPMLLEVNGTKLRGCYEKILTGGGQLACEGELRGPHGTRFVFHDQYRAVAGDAFELTRSVEVREPQAGDISFNSAFGMRLGEEARFEEQEVFVPGIWYRGNFSTRIPGDLAASPNDTDYFFREDRLPLPLISARDSRTGATITLSHLEAEPTTFLGDHGLKRVIDGRMQFGSVGMSRRPHITLMFIFPGSEGEKNRVPRENHLGWALRSHPVRTDVSHHYKLMLRAAKTPSYPDAVEHAWKGAFERYQPRLRNVDLPKAFHGLIDTLDHYAVTKADGYDAPGFPFSVLLPEGQARAYNYQMGFVGRQLPNAFFLLHEGIEQNRQDWLGKGEAIVDFWADECQRSDGLPQTWYDPSRDPKVRGRWRTSDNKHGGTALRVAATGMEGMLAAWTKIRASGRDKPKWLDACRKFGDWLAANQNADGSYYLAYGLESSGGRRNPTESSKATTANSIRFLVLLSQATQDARYRQAAIRAGEYCLRHVHDDYHYAGSVIDNPVTLDRESGQEALAAFLALRDLTKETKWLDAAIQAARYAETWMYAYEVPAVPGGFNAFPSDRSIVGQTLIATGQSGADLGLAFSAFDYYRLYLFTGDAHFLTVAKLLVHNTKQALNWDGTLYPGKPRGLQLEAFSVTMPRRRGVLECLSWNYAAHLDPLIRLKDRFGEIDIDVIERRPLAERRTLND